MGLNLFSDLVGHLVTEMCYLVSGVVWFVSELLKVNYLVVKWTLTLTLQLLDAFSRVCFSVLYAFQCGFQDFISFILELVGIIVGALELVEKGTLNLFQGIWNLWAFIVGTLTTITSCGHAVFRGTSWTLTSLVLNLSKLFELGIGGLSLLGETFLWTFKLIPMSIVGLGELFKSCCVYVFQSIKTFYRVLLLTIISTPGALLSALCAVPKDVYVGIVILCASAFVSRRFLSWRCLKALVMRPVTTLKHLGGTLQSIIMRAFCHIFALQRIIRTERSFVNVETVSEMHETEEESSEDRDQPSSSTSQQKSIPKSPVLRSEEAEMVKELQEQLERIRENHLCVVCQDVNKCIILLPCRHFCLCQACVSQILVRDPLCPVCRSQIQKVLHVYS